MTANMNFPFSPTTRSQLRDALHEDVKSGDITTLGTVPADRSGKAGLFAKSPGVLCGQSVFDEIFRMVDEAVTVSWLVTEGHSVEAGLTCADIQGPLSSILVAERTALNFLQRLSGIASLTRKYVQRVAHTRCRVLDTRKTTPLWRELEKYAVTVGGGLNHRMGLYDAFLIKDNHIAAAGGIRNAVEQALSYREENGLRCPIEIEVRNLEEVKEALNFPIERIMLDNMNLTAMRSAVELIDHACEVEASGGVSIDTVQAMAETGVDFISVGSLTHSAPALDISLLIANAG